MLHCSNRRAGLLRHLPKAGRFVLVSARGEEANAATGKARTMNDQSCSIAFLTPDWRQTLDLYLAERAHGINAYMISRARLASVARMNLMSDAELAALDLRREDIPAFVFEDLLPE